MGENNPEIPLEYQDLLEKLQCLADWQISGAVFLRLRFFRGADLTFSSRFMRALDA